MLTTTITTNKDLGTHLEYLRGYLEGRVSIIIVSKANINVRSSRVENPTWHFRLVRDEAGILFLPSSKIQKIRLRTVPPERENPP